MPKTMFHKPIKQAMPEPINRNALKRREREDIVESAIEVAVDGNIGDEWLIGEFGSYSSATVAATFVRKIIVSHNDPVTAHVRTFNNGKAGVWIRRVDGFAASTNGQ